MSLKESEDRFQKITNLAPIAIIMTNEAFEISYANQHARDLFGYSELEFSRYNLIDLIEEFSFGINHKLKINKLDFSINLPIFSQEKFTAYDKNKSKFSVILSSASILVKENQSYIFIIQDITEINQKEEIIQAQTARLRDILWYQSHIIRAPLARLMGIISLFEENLVSEAEAIYFHQAIIDSANELDRAIIEVTKQAD